MIEQDVMLDDASADPSVGVRQSLEWLGVRA